ncbi:MAG: hypothetical protein QOJ57_2843 [Thermoleophilaceae bacterium]|jgi:hypothetical protein|nr:hypothetical protein [Thermoleophilaceae bacterium]
MDEPRTAAARPGRVRWQPSATWRPAPLAAIIGVVALVSAIAAVFIVGYLRDVPPTVAAAASGEATVRLTLQTVPAIGSGRYPDWVSYLVQDADGGWHHSTELEVPANVTVEVTILQYDSATGLRDPFWAGPRGVLDGEFVLDGTSYDVLDPADASHTFAIPDLGLTVPLAGVAANATNQCQTAPCGDTAHRTITFRFHSGARGLHRFQCFVPCGGGFLNGNGGPMQTLGYMHGFLRVI